VYFNTVGFKLVMQNSQTDWGKNMCLFNLLKI
jgi:hypothetical protein